MVDSRILTDRLLTLTARVGNVRRKVGDRDTFLGDTDRQEQVAFNFMLAVQAGLDAAAHVISDRGLGLATTARAHFDLLASAGIIDAALAERLAGVTGARNLIAHAYDKLSQPRLFDDLPGGLGALEALAAALAATM